MPVADLSTIGARIPPRSYAAALFACDFKRHQAYKLYAQANRMVVHSLLRRDEWEELDRMVVEAGREPLVGVADLRARDDLLRKVSIATSLATYNKSSAMGPPNFAMNPLADGERQRMDYGLAGVPIPFAFIDFQLDIRTLEASRRLGEGLDMMQGAEASYQIAKAWEGMLFNGTPAIAVADRLGTLNTIYGYKTHPDRNTGTALGDWGDTTSGYLYAINTIQAMKAALQADLFFGPYWLYVNRHNWADIGVVNTQTDRRIMEVITADPEIAKLQVSSELDSGEIIMVDPKPRTIQWVEGAMLRPVEWDEKGGLGTNYRVIGAAAPLVKSTSSGQSGVAHWTQAT